MAPMDLGAQPATLIPEAAAGSCLPCSRPSFRSWGCPTRGHLGLQREALLYHVSFASSRDWWGVLLLTQSPDPFFVPWADMCVCGGGGGGGRRQRGTQPGNGRCRSPLRLLCLLVPWRDQGIPLGHLEPSFLPLGGEWGFPGCSEASCSKGHITHAHTMPGLPHPSLMSKASSRSRSKTPCGPEHCRFNLPSAGAWQESWRVRVCGQRCACSHTE